MKDLFIQCDTIEIPLFGSEDFVVDNIENLTWANTELSLATNPYRAGDIITNARGLARDVGITIKPLDKVGDFNNIVHKFARLVNQRIKLIWKNRSIPSLTLDRGNVPPQYYDDLECDLVLFGAVNEFDVPRFSNDVRLSFNIHCENPYWETVEKYRVDTVDGGLATPFCAYTEVKTGIEIEIPDLHLSSSETVRIEFESPRDVTGKDIKWYIAISPLIQGTTINYAYNKFTFDNGKVTVMSGADEASAVYTGALFKWAVYWAAYNPNTETYEYHKTNNFPALFPNTEQYYVRTVKNTTQIPSSISFKPRFI